MLRLQEETQIWQEVSKLRQLQDGDPPGVCRVSPGGMSGSAGHFLANHRQHQPQHLSLKNSQ